MSERLALAIADEISRKGPITFARFMERALYDSEDGYYARPPIGVEGDYVTSPHVSVAFAELLGAEIARLREQLGKEFAIVEVGAGDGTLASQLVAVGALDLDRYVCVERSTGARKTLAARGFEVRASLGDVDPIAGVVLAHEVLDNIPFHRIRRRADDLCEVFVDVRDGAFVEIELPMSDEARASIVSVPEGPEFPVSPGWGDLVTGMSKVLAQGWALVFDIGFTAGEPPQGVRAYAEQRTSGAVLSDPGSRDITTGVDFGSLTRVAIEAFDDVWGPFTQREVLLRLGLRGWLDSLRTRQAEAMNGGRSREAISLYAERSRAPLLADEAHLGAVKVLVLGRGVPPPSFAA